MRSRVSALPPKSGHVQRNTACLLCANSEHGKAAAPFRNDGLFLDRDQSAPLAADLICSSILDKLKEPGVWLGG